MNQKEKNKKTFFTKRRIIFSLVFFAFLFPIIVSFGNNVAKAEIWGLSDEEVGGVIRSEDKDFMNQQAEVAKSQEGINPLLLAFNYLFYAVFKLTTVILSLGAKLFDWGVDSKNFTSVMSLGGVKVGWTIVRDILNMFFILVLLFSAFCTIFQVEKFNIKKILLTLVIMALLVNFSFPISRFVIDTANVPMYYFLKVIASGSNSISTKIIQSSGTTEKGEGGIAELVLPGIDSFKKVDGRWSMTFQLISAIVFVFIFGITLLTMAILLLIRIVVLAILVIFSPIGFVGAILPTFSKYADDWWTALFKQSFFGPIMAFMIYIAIFMMNGMQNSINGQLRGIASSVLGQDSASLPALSAGLCLAIPVILLWASIISAQKMGAIGADEVAGRATKIAKWAGGLPWKGGKAAFKATGIPGGAKKTWEHYKKKGFPGLRKVPGFRGEEATETLETSIASGLTGDRTIYGGMMAKRMKEVGEKMDVQNMSGKELADLAKDKDSIKKAVAINELANRGLADTDQFNEVRSIFGEDSQVSRQIQNKMKAYNPTAAFTDMKGNIDEERLKSHLESNQFDFKKLSFSSLKPKFMELAFKAYAIGPKDIVELQKKGDKYKNEIRSSLSGIAKNFRNSSQEIDKNVHRAYFASTGEIQNSDFAKDIASNMDKDLAANMKPETITNNKIEIQNNIKQGRIKDIVYNMKDNAASKKLVEILKEGGHCSKYVREHPDLANLCD